MTQYTKQQHQQRIILSVNLLVKKKHTYLYSFVSRSFAFADRRAQRSLLTRSHQSLFPLADNATSFK
jgi:hypothetical protein